MSQISKTLVTAVGPNMVPVLERYSLPTFETYANTHGYDVSVVSLAGDSMQRKDEAAKAARWRKIGIMRDALMRSEVAVWFDADVMINRFDEDIVSHLGQQDYQGFVLHHVPAEDRINPNSGVWVMRRSEKSFDFLDAVEAEGMPVGRWADQGAIMRALGWNLGDDRYQGARIPETGSQYMQGTAWLPIGWNQPYCDDRPNPEAYVGRPLVDNPHAVHFMAMTIEERMVSMASLQQATANRTRTS